MLSMAFFNGEVWEGEGVEHEVSERANKGRERSPCLGQGQQTLIRL